MKKIAIIIISLFILIACSEEQPDVSAFEIRSIGELSTTEYTIGKIVKVDDSKMNLTDIEWKEWTEIPEYGERKILISCKAKVKAGVDLTQIQDEDIIVKGNTIEITLPPSEITSFTMDPSLITTEMQSISGTMGTFTQEEKNQILKQGEEAIKNDLNDTGIFEDANENAEAFLIDFYRQLGYDEVTIKRGANE